MSARVASPHKPQLASEDCLVFYRFRYFRFAQIIDFAVELKDPTILVHGLECDECRAHILERERFSSSSEIDAPLHAALERLDAFH